MYLKKQTGPRAVTLPDGTILTRADLPPPDTKRWVASRKLTVVRALAAGLMTEKEAIERYGLSEEELSGWCRAAANYGTEGLKVTTLGRTRQL